MKFYDIEIFLQFIEYIELTIIFYVEKLTSFDVNY